MGLKRVGVWNVRFTDDRRSLNVAAETITEAVHMAIRYADVTIHEVTDCSQINYIMEEDEVDNE